MWSMQMPTTMIEELVVKWSYWMLLVVGLIPFSGCSQPSIPSCKLEESRSRWSTGESVRLSPMIAPRVTVRDLTLRVPSFLLWQQLPLHRVFLKYLLYGLDKYVDNLLHFFLFNVESRGQKCVVTPVSIDVGTTSEPHDDDVVEQASLLKKYSKGTSLEVYFRSFRTCEVELDAPE